MKKRITFTGLIIIIILGSLLSNNQLEHTKTIDIALLIALGMLFGILFINLRVMLRNQF